MLYELINCLPTGRFAGIRSVFDSVKLTLPVHHFSDAQQRRTGITPILSGSHIDESQKRQRGALILLLSRKPDFRKTSQKLAVL